MIPEVFTEADRQVAILRATLDNAFYPEGVPALICNLNPDTISAALRLHEKIGIPWCAFHEGFHFVIAPTSDQLIILKSFVGLGYFYGTPAVMNTFIMVDSVSKVPFEVYRPS